jgi:5-methylcytosine-specific restriction endonuclease McrA
MSDARSPSSSSGTRQMSAYERQRLRKARMKSQDGKCAICGLELGRDQSLDHIVPVSKGGKNVWSNFQLTHEKCNKSKGNRE